jgi:hypothetical protein
MEAKDYFVHESSYVDEPCLIGPGTKIWHFSHVMKNSRIGAGCNIGGPSPDQRGLVFVFPDHVAAWVHHIRKYH